jgi:hypothetical protein
MMTNSPIFRSFWQRVDDALVSQGECPAEFIEVHENLDLADDAGDADDVDAVVQAIIHHRERLAEDARFNREYAAEMAGDVFRWGDR